LAWLFFISIWEDASQNFQVPVTSEWEVEKPLFSIL
jgi:hypothetical protein